MRKFEQICEARMALCENVPTAPQQTNGQPVVQQTNGQPVAQQTNGQPAPQQTNGTAPQTVVMSDKAKDALTNRTGEVLNVPSVVSAVNAAAEKLPPAPVNQTAPTAMNTNQQQNGSTAPQNQQGGVTPAMQQATK